MMIRISLICLLLFGAFAGMAQTLTCSFQFTASGTLGTQPFTNAAITITTVSSPATRVSGTLNTVDNTAASIAVAGLGTFQITTATQIAETVSPPNSAPGSAVTESISFSAGGNIFGVQLNRTIVNSNSWNMPSSLGPITSGQTNISAWDVFPVSTGGGRLTFYTVSSVQITFQATYAGTPPPPTLSRVGVLSHIAAGGGWTTVIALVNTSSVAAPVTVALHGDDGSALALPVTTAPQGISQTTNTSSVTATINPNATLLISVGDQAASTVAGWADVLSTGSLGGYAIFRSTPQTGSPSEGTVPLQSQFPSTATLPYDNTAGFTMGVALANMSTAVASVTVTMWDDSGDQLGTQAITISGSGHTAFVLPNQFPLTSGKRGIVKFQATGGIAGVGLRFSPFGTFTSVPTM
jgi:hypothetical protein